MQINNLKELGQTIRDKRKKQKITQTELAMITNSSVRLIVDLERGERSIRTDKLIKICTRLGLKINIG